MTRAEGRRSTRSARVLMVVFGALAAAILAVVLLVPPSYWWLCWLAGFPGAIVMHQGVLLAIFKNSSFFEEQQRNGLAQVHEQNRPFVQAAMAQERRYYSSASLALRFAIPAVMIALECLIIGAVLSDATLRADLPLRADFLLGAQLGAAGAYVYVVLFLGGRALVSDITPASIWWAMVVLCAALMLAGCLEILTLDLPNKSDTGELIHGASWSQLLLPFAAGFALRFTVDVVNAAIRRPSAASSTWPPAWCRWASSAASRERSKTGWQRKGSAMSPAWP